MALDTPDLANSVLSIFSVASGEKAYNSAVTYDSVMTGDERRSPDDTGSGSGARPEGSPETGDEVAGDAAADADASGGETDLDALSYRELQSLASAHDVAPVGHGAAELRELIAEARDGRSQREDGVENESPTDDDDTTAEAASGGDADGEVDTDGEDGGELTEIPTVDPDHGQDDATDANEDADGDDSDEDAVPDWVQSDEPATQDVIDEGDDPDERASESEDGLDPHAARPPESPADAGLADGNDAETDDDGLAQSDGGATVVDGEKPELDYSYYEEGTGTGFGDGPESDEEMPLSSHIEEMVKRLGIVILSMALVSVLVLPFAVDLINFIWYSILGSVQSSVTSPRAYQPLALVLARLKVATLAGFVIALPVFVYETYLFMRPGLYKHERRYYLAAVPTSLVLAFIGVAFAFYLVLPFIFSYFVSYSEQAADIAFGLTETFGLMLLLMGFFAAVFQIPLLIMLAVMMGLTTRRWLVQRRLYFWGGFLGVALLFSPDPTGMAPFIVAITMVVLFEGTLLLLRWTQR